LQKACLAKRRSEHSYKRAPSYMDVASMKLKQDVESSWQYPFVSVSEEESKAQHAFCNVKEGKGGRYLGVMCRTRGFLKRNGRICARFFGVGVPEHASPCCRIDIVELVAVGKHV